MEEFKVFIAGVVVDSLYPILTVQLLELSPAQMVDIH